jgi:hypothetical protein
MCIYALINQLICITNNECLILHHKTFRADYISHSTKNRAPTAARIIILREFQYKKVYEIVIKLYMSNDSFKYYHC